MGEIEELNDMLTSLGEGEETAKLRAVIRRLISFLDMVLSGLIEFQEDHKAEHAKTLWDKLNDSISR